MQVDSTGDAPAAAPAAPLTSALPKPDTSSSGGPSEGASPRVKREWKQKRQMTDFQEYQQVDYVRQMTARNVWYYRDRLSVPRGPCTMPVLREAWSNGVIDENTIVW